MLVHRFAMIVIEFDITWMHEWANPLDDGSAGEVETGRLDVLARDFHARVCSAARVELTTLIASLSRNKAVCLSCVSLEIATAWCRVFPYALAGGARPLGSMCSVEGQ